MLVNRWVVEPVDYLGVYNRVEVKTATWQVIAEDRIPVQTLPFSTRQCSGNTCAESKHLTLCSLCDNNEKAGD